MAILRAYSRGLAFGGPQQPRGEMAIDWSHPLASGLSLLQMLDRPNGLLFIDNGDLDGGGLNPQIGGPFGGASAGIGLNGITQFKSNGVNYQIPTAAGSCFSYITAGWSPTDGVDHNGFLAGAIFTSLRKFSDNNWYSGWLSGSDTRVVVAGAGTFVVGDSFSMGCTWSTAAGTTMYSKGINRGNNPSAPSTGSTVGATWSFNETSSPFNTSAGRDAIYYIAFWNRILSAGEIALLDADPYCFLTSAEGEMPSLFTTATPPPTSTLYSLINVG